jgi:glycosyltransferase involved in cell wall biosynthesis
MTDYGVVIPAFNAERTLRETLESVFAQTAPAAEIVVVDDGSTDGTADLVAAVSPRVRVVRQANAGPGAATSRGVREIHSPLVAMADADDVWLPSKMEIQLRALTADPAIALVSANMRQFRHGQVDDGQGEMRSGPTRSTIVVRREVFLAVGDVFDPPGRCGEMVDWLARLLGQGYRMHAVDEVLALRRVISGSLSQRRAERHGEGLLAVAHRALLRQRGQGPKAGGIVHETTPG